MRKTKKNEWRKKIGYVSQEPTIFDDTIFNNITLWASESCDVRDLQVVQSKLPRTRTFMTSSKVCQRNIRLVGDRGVRLSGGKAKTCNCP